MIKNLLEWLRCDTAEDRANMDCYLAIMDKVVETQRGGIVMATRTELRGAMRHASRTLAALELEAILNGATDKFCGRTIRIVHENT